MKRFVHGQRTHRKNLARKRAKTPGGISHLENIAKHHQEAADKRAAKLQIGKMNKTKARKAVGRVIKGRQAQAAREAQSKKDFDAAKKKYPPKDLPQERTYSHTPSDHKDKSKPAGFFGRMGKGISRVFSKKGR